ncbi:MAG: hypothetical protein RLZZ360_335 [Candidatus Parcubacteria bacterium]|jgi:hypothetical protein
MKWHPFLNALAATLYITGLVSFLQWIETFKANTPDTLIDGVGAISLFTFSGSVMAFLIFYQPLVRLIDKDYRGGLNYFLATLGYFGLTTAIILTTVLWH